MKAHRIWALVSRHLYLYKRSLPRLMEVFYWPLLDLLLWGFITIYLKGYKENLPGYVTFFIGALILWDILFRSQSGISVSFLEEIWSRNLLNLFVSPLKVSEFLISTMLISIFKVIAISVVSAILALIFYSFNILSIGISLLPLVINLLIMGWAIGIITTALILRYGQQAEILAWGLAFLFQPVSAVFYPVDVLPGFLRAIAKFIPSSHVFEGMRGVIRGGGIPINELIWASGLNVVYLTSSIIFFNWTFKIAKIKGSLVKTGE